MSLILTPEEINALIDALQKKYPAFKGFTESQTRQLQSGYGACVVNGTPEHTVIISLLRTMGPKLIVFVEYQMPEATDLESSFEPSGFKSCMKDASSLAPSNV